jgi:hypothetical protein
MVYGCVAEGEPLLVLKFFCGTSNFYFEINLFDAVNAKSTPRNNFIGAILANYVI